MESTTDIGTRVRSRRRELRVTQEEAARKAGVPLSSLARIERGEVKDPHVSMLCAIAPALDMSVAEILGEEPVAAGKGDAPGTGLTPGQPQPVKEQAKELAVYAIGDFARIADEMYEWEMRALAAFYQGLWESVQNANASPEALRKDYGDFVTRLFLLQGKLALRGEPWAGVPAKEPPWRKQQQDES
jgi:transcriptional regulator with XRE-family HTH domain